MKLPTDYTPEEYELFRYLSKGNDDPVDTTRIYQLLPDPVDKFLVCYIFEAKYTRRQAEKALGLSKVTIWSKLKQIKRILYKDAKSKHLVEMIDKL
jgi:hypothetical protein